DRPACKEKITYLFSHASHPGRNEAPRRVQNDGRDSNPEGLGPNSKTILCAALTPPGHSRSLCRRDMRGAAISLNAAPPEADMPTTRGLRTDALTNRWIDPRWLGAVIAVVTFATFLPALRNGFVNFDDQKNFLTNFDYRGVGLAQLKWMFST